MLRLASMLYAIVASTLAGSGVVAVLVAGVTEPIPLIAAAVVGAILALPVSYFVASRMVV